MRQTAILVAALLAGCATSGGTWTAPVSHQQYYADHAECMAMSGQPAQVQNPGAVTNSPQANAFIRGMNQGQAAVANRQRREIYMSCMYGRGYKLQ